ncbi:MAG: hypothetical protein ABI460_03730 [Caldimonas sp.]
MSDATSKDDDKTAPEPALAASLAGVVDAALGVGVSLARMMAEATATGPSIASVPSGTPPVQAIVRYGVTAVSNVAQAVMAGARGVGKASPAAAKPAPTARAAGPRVRAGTTLRVPLSVENPGDRPMLGLQPLARRVRRAAGGDALALLPLDAVTFSPRQFDVAPRDFEKLVVQVELPVDLPEGGYELTLALGDDEPDLPVAFTVLPAAS